LVGDQIIGNDSSQRSARAATCAHTVGAFWAYHSTIFRNQPHEGVGYTDELLRNDFAAEAGITGDALTRFQTCYDTGATNEQVKAMESEGSAAGVNGTPYFFVNGWQTNFDLQTDTPISTDDLLEGLRLVVAGG
ncbi:MAG: thioredoxin domain-containing protein, partial [Propionibacteriaceae bacterium]|nr:thioredoxin domain-containing protein [Propionibacteriaceae bacterium]